nr:MAG TPA: hypothetical protein [Caudoviricetes sp.]
MVFVSLRLCAVVEWRWGVLLLTCTVQYVWYVLCPSQCSTH